MKFNLERNIKFVSLKYYWLDLEIYKKIMYLVSFSVAIFFSVLGYIYYRDTNAIIVGFISLILALLVFYYYPISLKRFYIGKIERDLPFMLMDLDIKLSIGMNFFIALKDITKEYDYLGILIKKVLNQHEKGIPIHKTFAELSNFYESQDFKRALNQIYAIYQTGYNSENQGPLFMLAQELLDKQKSESKVYQGKLVMISLFFIGITALVPSLFLVFITIGSSIFDVGLSPTELLLVYVVIFPIIDMAIIFFIYNITPAFLK